MDKLIVSSIFVLMILTLFGFIYWTRLEAEKMKGGKSKKSKQDKLMAKLK